MEFSIHFLEKALNLLGQLLLEQGYHYEVVAVGGGGLLLLGYIKRSTKDIDLVALIENDKLISPIPLPKPLSQAIHDVSLTLNLNRDWMNTAPSDLFRMGLPEKFEMRLEKRSYGGLTLYLASRFDQICFKLYAAVDQGPDSKHFADLKQLYPTQSELQKAAAWCVTHDVSQGFADNLKAALVAIEGA